MAVSFTYSPGFGVKITVGLPRHVGREAGFELCDAIEALVRERLEGAEVEGRLSSGFSGGPLRGGAAEVSQAADEVPMARSGLTVVGLRSGRSVAGFLFGILCVFGLLAEAVF